MSHIYSDSEINGINQRIKALVEEKQILRAQLKIAIEVLKYIDSCRDKSCRDSLCTCAYDTANIALSEIDKISKPPEYVPIDEWMPDLRKQIEVVLNCSDIGDVPRMVMILVRQAFEKASS